VDVVVPDSYVGFLRLLSFLYTGCVPEGEGVQLLDDLLVADRYTLGDMRGICESMIQPDSDTWVDTWRVALAIGSQRLIEGV